MTTLPTTLSGKLQDSATGSADDSEIEDATLPENERLAHLIKEAYRGVHRSLQIRLLEFGTPSGLWSFLRVLWDSDGLTQRELSEKAGYTEPTTFTAVKAMEKLGLVIRHSPPENRRKVHIILTRKGMDLKDQLVPQALNVNTKAIQGIDPNDVTITRRTLIAIIRNLRADEAEAMTHERRMPSNRQLSLIVDQSAKRAAKVRTTKGTVRKKRQVD